ncbi:DUF6443 domain-containing protein [Lacihabitans lacunae]|uniref:DUF6443 domain-containing protein n=1 Tax=Lacihabitans lacunae TaxID=1028214 RepID=A0ABV7Z4S9_9BACT
MKKILPSILLILLGLEGFTQTDSTKTDSTRIFSAQADPYKKYIPNYSPLPPNTAAFQKFGDYSVNLATGVPDISIPIYTVQDGDLSLPVVLRYHASGHRINELASWVGWGFSLDAGGAINRSIESIADDKPIATNYLNNPIINRDLCNSASDYSFLNTVENGLADTQPDLFTYSAPSVSGKFMLRHNGVPPFLMPWQPHIINYGIGTNTTINSFEVINENGQLYRFGKYADGTEVNEFQTIPTSFGLENAGIVSWPLTQILSPNANDKIELSYQDGGTIQQSSLSYSATINYNAAGFPTSYGTTPTPSTQTRQNTQKNIHKITFNNGEVEFVQSTANRADFADGHSLESIKIYNYENGEKRLMKLYSFHYSYFTDRLGNNGRLRLDSLRFSDATLTDIQTYKFEYTTSNYSWFYKEGSNSDLSDMAKIDYFGYYNHQNNAHTLDSPFNGVTWTGSNANRNSNETYIKQAVLNKIVYPSGGFTLFDFEANKIIRNSSIYTAGGLRIKTIKHYLANASLSFLKRYEFSSADGSGFGKLTTGNWGFPATGLVGTVQYLSGTDILKTDIISPDANIQANPFDSSPVYYTLVTVFEEENIDPVKIGRTEHTFSFEPDIIVSSPFTLQRNIEPWKRGQELSLKFFDTDNVLKYAKITDYQIYKNESIQNFQLVYKINEANAICNSCNSGMPFGFLTNGGQISATQNSTSCNNPRLVFFNGSNLTGAIKPIQINEVRDGVNNMVSLHYNENLLPDTTTTENSQVGHYYQDINIFSTNSSYNADAIALEMRSRNMIANPLENKTRENIGSGYSDIFHQKNNYNSFTGTNARGLTNNILPSETWVAATGGTLEKRVEFKNYDAYGNILSYELDGQPTTLIYGYNNSLVLGLVKNATLSHVNTALSSTGLSPAAFSVSTLSAAQETILQNFQNAIPNTLIDWYLHRPHIGLSQHFAPNGLKTSYFYDSHQRFSKATDHEGNILQTNEYKISPAENYIASAKPRIATTNDVSAKSYLNSIVDYQHFDGLGRPTQAIGIGQTPDLKSLIKSEINYDKYNRQLSTLLPVAATSTVYAPISNAKSLAQSFYADTAPTDSTIFEASPLNRPMASFGAGQAWRAANKKTQIFYESGGTEVRYYAVNASNNIVLSGTYPAHSLFKKRVLDEQGNETIAYTDKRGRMIEKRQQLQTGVYAHTHYLYDGLGRPKAIIQPMGYDLNLGFTYNSADFQKWVFFYNYDTRGRNTEKHVPAAGFTKMIYDKKDRLVMQQDAFQATLNKWNFQKYDAFDREVFRGETLNANAQSVLQSAFNVYTAPDEVWNSGSGYSGTSFPAMVNPSINDVQLFTFYDQYDFVSALNNNLAFEGGSAFHAKHTSAKGLQTGTVAYNQADPSSASSGTRQFFISANYFDTKNRSIQAKTQNHLGGIDLVNTKYGFAGQVLQNNVTHRKAGQADISNQTQTDYDPMLRHSINGQAFKVLANYSYDDLGRLNRKIIEPGAVDYTCGNSKESMTSGSWTQPSTWQGSSIPTVGDAVKINVGHTVNLFNQQSQDIMYVITYGGLNISGAGTRLNLKFVGNNTTNLTTALQTIDYAYHIRGWLKGINPSLNTAEGDLFSYKLDYETAGYYDGNIGKITWQSPDNPYSCAKPTRSYTYSYDKSSRLLNATYASNVSNENFGIAGMSYDKNGNINTLQRYGINGSAFGLIDNLSYFYSGNRLTGVSDAVSGNPNVGDFRASGNSSNYTYYPNGSLKSDANKGISLIEYNTYLNKVKQVTWSDGRWLKFNYDGAGSLLKKENSAGEYWDYVGDLIYKNGNNYSLNYAEGRIVFTNNSWNYEYDYRDIWGNLRLSFASENGQLKVKQQSDFDPFGYIFNQSAGVNKNHFQYQKQQRIEDFDLNIDFFKFRPSDPTIGRFWMVDPLSSQYPHNSTYALQENKFGMGVELEGAELQPFYPNLQGELYRSAGVNSSTDAQKVGKELLTAYTKALGTVMLMAAPIEELAVGGLLAVGIKAEATLAKEGALLLRTGGQEAKSAASLDKLNRSLASESQMAGKSESIAGAGSKTPLKKAEDMAKQYGGDAKDYAKMRSNSSYKANDGTKIETHWEENIKTGEKYNTKTKINNEEPPAPSGQRYQQKLDKIKQ